jgi:hypothetical protein
VPSLFQAIIRTTREEMRIDLLRCPGGRVYLYVSVALPGLSGVRRLEASSSSSVGRATATFAAFRNTFRGSLPSCWKLASSFRILAYLWLMFGPLLQSSETSTYEESGQGGCTLKDFVSAYNSVQTVSYDDYFLPVKCQVIYGEQNR